MSKYVKKLTIANTIARWISFDPMYRATYSRFPAVLQTTGW